MTYALRLLPAAIGLALLQPLYAQNTPSRLTFDVAVVRPSKLDQPGGFIKPLANGRGYTAQNMTVEVMVSLMYEVPMRQIKGGPDWFNTERFDVEAKADRSYNREDLHQMYRNLLEDRFGLKLHKDVKEGPVYLLTIDPAGLKMKANPSTEDYDVPVQGPPQRVVGKRVPMPYLCWWLGQVLQADERPVVNRSGLTGNYDFTLSFRPQLPPGAASDALPPELQELPPIFTALKEQLGLKLQPQKGPVDYYVIDRLTKPTEN